MDLHLIVIVSRPIVFVFADERLCKNFSELEFTETCLYMYKYFGEVRVMRVNIMHVFVVLFNTVMFSSFWEIQILPFNF